MRKKRILFSTEFSGLHTGYSCITKNLLREIHNTGRFEVAEHSRYCNESDPRHQQIIKSIPWKVYGNLPTNAQEEQIYNNHPANEFGQWKHDYVCLDFQADIVCGISDIWMDLHLSQSIFRHIYKMVEMPAIDAQSQNEEWLDFYARCDHVLTYTEFAEKTLQEEGGGTINLSGVATPATDTNIYFPIQNKSQHKQQMGLPANSIIIGMVARNQKRKLYPELAQAFVDFIRESDFGDSSNVYLYFHCSSIDVGWNIPNIIKNSGLSHKVLMTYFCNNCGYYFPSFYRDAVTICSRCHQGSCTTSNSQIGVDDASLAKIYNCMDLYVQFVTNEAQGIPTVEAAMCGVPVCGTYYSGTQTLLDKLCGHPIPVRTFFIEVETGRKLALPSIYDLVGYIKEFTSLPEGIRLRMGMKTAALARAAYGSWSDVAQKWINVFDQISIPEKSLWLTTPIDIVNVEGLQAPGPDKMNDEQFVNWCLGEILHYPEWINSYSGLKMWRDLSWGRTVKNTLGFFANEMSVLGAKPMFDLFDRNKCLDMVKDMRRRYNESEKMRAHYIQTRTTQ